MAKISALTHSSAQMQGVWYGCDVIDDEHAPHTLTRFAAAWERRRVRKTEIKGCGRGERAVWIVRRTEKLNLC